MTNEIILNGVEVSKCRFYKEGLCCLSYAFVENGYDCVECSECYNCDFKQLFCKTVECERLKKYKDVVDILAGKQIILTDKDKMPKLYENPKDLMISQYKQALDDIAEIATKILNAYKLCSFGCDACEADEILNIISKTKDGKNG